MFLALWNVYFVEKRHWQQVICNWLNNDNQNSIRLNCSYRSTVNDVLDAVAIVTVAPIAVFKCACFSCTHASWITCVFSPLNYESVSAILCMVWVSECVCNCLCVNECYKFNPQASHAFSCGVSLPLSLKVYQITQRFILRLCSKGWRFLFQKILFLGLKSILCHTVYWSFCSSEHYTLSLLGMDIWDFWLACSPRQTHRGLRSKQTQIDVPDMQTKTTHILYNLKCTMPSCVCVCGRLHNISFNLKISTRFLGEFFARHYLLFLAPNIQIWIFYLANMPKCDRSLAKNLLSPQFAT